MALTLANDNASASLTKSVPSLSLAGVFAIWATIVYLAASAMLAHQSTPFYGPGPTLYGAAVIFAIAFISYRFRGFGLACWLGCLMSTLGFAQVQPAGMPTLGLGTDGFLVAATLLTIVSAGPFLVFYLFPGLGKHKQPRTKT